MKSSNALFNKLSHIFFICSVVSAFIFLAYIATHSMLADVPLNEHILHNLNTNWSYSLPNSSASPITSLPAHLSLPEETTTLTLTRPLTEASPQSDYLLLRSSQQSLDILIDDHLIYSYHISSPIGFENYTASAWHLIELPHNYDYSTPHVLSLKLAAFNSSYAGIINEVYIGSQISCLYMLFKNYGFGWLTCLLLLLLGIGLISYSLFSFFKSHHHTPLFHLGVFAVCAAIWSASEGKLLQFFISNREFEYYLNYCLVFLLPIPFLFYIKKHYTLRTSWLYDLLIWLFALNFITCVMLVSLNIKTFLELELGFKIILMLTLAACSITFFSLIKRHNKANHIFISGYLFLIFTAVLDLTRNFMGFLVDSSSCFRIGLLVFVCTTTFDFERHLMESAQQKTKNKILETLAYTDTMTGLLNRTAFHQKLELLDQQLSNVHHLALLILDINNLKTTNDTLGHSSGDVLIIHTASLLKHIYGDIACIYRIGGDEFVAVFENLPENLLKCYLQKFQHELNIYNTTHSPKLSIASGYSYYISDIHHNMHDVFIVADENMYDCKQSCKIQQSAKV